MKLDLEAVTKAVHEKNVPVKVIFENCYLSEEDIIVACKICNEIGVDFVKTSTGYGTDGAEDKDLKIMRKYANPEIQIKAAGDVRTLERAIEVKKTGMYTVWLYCHGGNTGAVEMNNFAISCQGIHSMINKKSFLFNCNIIYNS